MSQPVKSKSAVPSELNHLKREIKLEKGLEYVRTKTMAMRKSAELAVVGNAVLNQMKKLGIEAETSWFWFINQKANSIEIWTTHENHIAESVTVEASELWTFKKELDAWKKKIPFLKIKIPKKEAIASLRKIFKIKLTSNRKASHFHLLQSRHSFGFLGLGTWMEPSEEEIYVVRRFTKVFEQTYSRFLDLQKAEAQARESKIQLALERVRARTMAMQSSNELAEVSFLLNKQVVELGIPTRGCAFNIYNENDSTEWFSNLEGTLPSYKTPRENVFLKYYEGGQRGETLLIEEYGGRKIKNHYRYLRKAGILGEGVTDKKLQQITPEFQIDHVAYFKYGYLLFITLVPAPDAHDVFKRFANEFEQTYTRFLDLKKAEEQAREAQIEAALERVRARTMGMHKSDELTDAITVLFKQFIELDLKPVACGFVIVNAKDKTGEVYITADGTVIPDSFVLPYHSEPAQDRIYQSWKKDEPYVIVDLKGKELDTHLGYIAKNMPVREMLQASGDARPDRLALHMIHFKHGFLGINYLEPNENVVPLLIRFAKVFEQTYTRFLDLQKAEVQARESEIQLALERVRSAAMSMHTSDELSNTITVLFQQLNILGINPINTYLVLYNLNQNQFSFRMTGKGGSQLTEMMTFSFDKLPGFKPALNAWKSGEPVIEAEYLGENRKKWLALIRPMNSKLPKENQLSLKDFPNGVYSCSGRHDFGSLGIMKDKKASEEEKQLLKRFAKEFNQTFTRFLDLQKAEAQVREAQIEAALEKVRGRAMEMHLSEDVNKALLTLFDEIKKLGIVPLACGLNILSPSGKMETWTAKGVAKSTVGVSGKLDLRSHPSVKKLMRDWKAKKSVSVYELKGRQVKDFYKEVYSQRDYKTPKTKLPERLILNNYLIPEGSLFAFTLDAVSEEHATVLTRFAKVFSLTYRRYKDLQKAEAQAREAQIEAALERVRSRSLAMHKSEELQRVVEVVYEQLKTLGLNMDAVQIEIFEESNAINVWVANEEQPYARKIRIPHLNRSFTKKFMDARNKGLDEFSSVTPKKEKNSFYRIAFKQTDLRDIPAHRKRKMLAAPCISMYAAFMKKTGLHLLTFSAHKYGPEDKRIVKRFAEVFEQTYIRFLDLQKAEAQAREAQIEASLERVRSKTMAMHNSQDVGNTIATLFEELVELGLDKSARCGIVIMNDDSNISEIWAAAKNDKKELTSIIGTLDMTLHPLLKGVRQSWKNKKQSFKLTLQGADVKKYYKALHDYPDYPIPVDLKTLPKKTFHNSFSFTDGVIFSFTPNDISDEFANVFKRFAGVFGQTYKRYQDLLKAEAQAREAQIEAALERVRARSMAMHKSEELLDVITVVAEQLLQLDFRFDHVSFANSDFEQDYKFWTAARVKPKPMRLSVPHIDIPMFNHLREAQQKGLTFFTDILTKQENREWHKQLLRNSDNLFSKEENEYIMSRGMARSVVIHPNIILILANYASVPYSEHENKIIIRFGQVFEQSYTRFLDLQKAEEQARESQIQLALERVRARTMAMHKSEELSETAAVLFEQFSILGNSPERINLGIFKEESGHIEWWITTQEGHQIKNNFITRFDEHPVISGMINAWKAKEKLNISTLSGKAVTDWINYITQQLGMPVNPNLVSEKRFLTSAYFSQGLIGTTTSEPLPSETIHLLERFAGVFEQTYTRFSDLLRSEAQAREAQIEAALERVRGKAMAMHSSEDLATTMKTFYHELELFSITPRRCGIGLIEKETRMVELSTVNKTKAGQSIIAIGKLKMTGHPVLEGIFNNWLLQKEYHPVLRGNEIKEYNQLIRPHVPFPEYSNDAIQYGYFFFIEVGGVYAWTENELTEGELKIYRRFTNVLSLTYKRYTDLKDAEVREKEAIKQAALDRVRADIASMRNTADLDRITPLIWKELTTLDIPFIRCGVFIMDENLQQLHTFLSTPDGKAIAAFHLPYDTPGRTNEILASWQRKKVYIAHWDEAAFSELGDLLVQQGALPSKDVYLKTIPKGGIYLHCLPFLQGMLYVGNTKRLKEDDIQLIQSVADAFSTAYARYEDFNKLEQAKQQVEKTLMDLKQAQQQLVQSEKMASLGELTAGIAHEIQNPLNFVNNFSEVSNELIKEILEIRSKTQDESVLSEMDELLQDIANNLEKINHHGKRAEGIVKGMLQHSRTSSGTKEPTDINVLCDEYLRLAYHGLRAKDKSFNAKFETDFDPTIPKINIVPQDIGRVVLNLINNAFYSVNEKAKQSIPGYQPTVTVSTSHSEESGIIGIKNIIKIIVKDNGPGIPEHIKEKIFQPFFTTKPTGQGTGLGLSLSYDIVKAHGGELRVETKEGEARPDEPVGRGSTFCITLPIV